MGRLLTVLLQDGTEHDIDLDAPESTSMAALARRFAERWGEPAGQHTADAEGAEAGTGPSSAGTVTDAEGTADRGGAGDSSERGVTAGPENTVRFGAGAFSVGPGAHDGEPHAESVSALQTASGPLPASMTLRDSPLRDGARVGFGIRPPGDAPPPGEFELRIVAGPGAGTIHSYTLDDLRRTALLPGRAETTGWSLSLYSTRTRPNLLGVRRKYVVIDGKLVKATAFTARWQGTLLTMGNVCMEFCPTPKAGTRPSALGAAGTTVFDVAPEHHARPASGSVSTDDRTRWYHGPQTRRRLAEDRARQAERFPLVQAAAQSRQALPDAAEVLSLVSRRSNRVWERVPSARDFLTLRCGLDMTVPPPGFDAVAELVTANGGVRPAPVGDATPVAEVPLRALGLVGVVGPGGLSRRVAAWFAAQAAALHSPHDVVVRVLTDEEQAGPWGWLRWLPRSSSPFDVDEPPRVLGESRRRGAAEALRAFQDMVHERHRSGWPGPGHGAPEVLLVVDCPADGPTQDMIRLARLGPPVGVRVVWAAARPDQLPSRCDMVVTATDSGRGSLRTADGATRDVLLDLVPWPYFERLARSLAPLRDRDAEERRQALRENALPEVLGPETVTPDTIMDGWRAAPHRTAAPVGLGTSGPYSLDLRRDGPHALVHGAIGTGKTEFLRTLVTSLAVANRPDELMFVLMDHKGGPAFARAARLPHVTALLTDFDSRQSARILTWLGVMLRSRERLLASHQVKDLGDYLEARRRRPELPPLPRLVFVVDEFASLAREAPELANGLVDTARRGRSLGLHLVLATQETAMADRDVMASTNLRICLRAASDVESDEILNVPHAAHIGRSTPGRAFVRSGSNRLDEVQFAQVSKAATVGRQEITIRDMGPRGELPPHPGKAGDPWVLDTPLDTLVSAVRTATRALRIEVPPGPLPPPLAETVTLAEVAWDQASGADVPPVAYGIQEAPDEPDRQTALFDLARTGSLSVTGTLRSGRTQFLRTFAAAVARQNSTADVHLFGIDCGNGGLQALTGLPHCGAVVTPGRPDHIGRLLGRLSATVFLRKELLADAGFRDLAAQRQAVPADQRLPYLVVLLDGWDAFASLDAGHTDFAVELLGLLREGADVGLRLVVTGGRALLSDPLSRFEERLVLGLDSRLDYRLVRIDARLVPLSLTPGRAFHAGSSTETQVALLDGDPSRQGQTDALDALAARLRERDAHVPDSRRPFRIEDAPRAADQFRVGAGKGRPVGREDVLAWLRDRCTTGASSVLLGPRRAGKTWVLEELRNRLTADGLRAVHKLVVPEPSSSVESPDALASILLRDVRESAYPAEALLDRAAAGTGSDRLVFLLDEVGRLASYGPAAVSWLRDLGQAGAWLMYTGTEKDWLSVVKWALTLPGSSFGNDINRRVLGPLGRDAALDFLTGTAANLGVNLVRDTTATRIVDLVGTWPFYLQAVGDGVVRAVQGNDLRPLNSEEALRALVERRLLDDWTLHFRSRWAEIGAAGRAALLARPGEQPCDASPEQRQDLREVGLLLPGERWSEDPPFLAWIARNEISLRDEELPA